MTHHKTKSTHYYQIHEVKRNQYLVAKLDRDLEVITTYNIIYSRDDITGKSELICTCPSYRRPCKHAHMWRQYDKQRKFNLDYVFDPSINGLIKREAIPL